MKKVFLILSLLTISGCLKEPDSSSNGGSDKQKTEHKPSIDYPNCKLRTNNSKITTYSVNLSGQELQITSYIDCLPTTDDTLQAVEVVEVKSAQKVEQLTRFLAEGTASSLSANSRPKPDLQDTFDIENFKRSLSSSGKTKLESFELNIDFDYYMDQIRARFGMLLDECPDSDYRRFAISQIAGRQVNLTLFGFSILDRQTRSSALNLKIKIKDKSIVSSSHISLPTTFRPSMTYRDPKKEALGIDILGGATPANHVKEIDFGKYLDVCRSAKEHIREVNPTPGVDRNTLVSNFLDQREFLDSELELDLPNKKTPYSLLPIMNIDIEFFSITDETKLLWEQINEAI